ncbi:MAG: M81 family metallopeptidase [Planctomycetaceae bacterium]|nr:M81 family metallopeptidase [Planctomycetaceae bacterium]
MRIAIGQLWQETNTFNPLATTRADFEAFGILRGTDVVAHMAETNELGGFIQSLRRWPEKPEIVGLVRLPAWPSGRATAETFEWLKAELIGALRTAWPVDGVLLALHGALAAMDHPDVEGEVLEALRQLLGTSVPIVATLDLHANVTRRMVEHADALVLYHTAPHVDVFETGQRGAAVLKRLLAGQSRPVTAFCKVPCVLPAERANTEAAAGVSADLKRKLQALEKQPDVLAAGIATVQPWLDIPDLASAAIVTTAGQPELAQRLCSELADELWQRRREYLPELVSVEEGVRRAHEQAGGLVVLSDAADATTSGAPGDSVWLLREMLKYRWPRPVLVTVVAPEIVAQAQKLGIGANWSGSIGGIRDWRFGIRLPITAQVERVFDARFVMSGHLGRNLAIDMGPSAVLRLGQVRVIVTSRSGPHFAPELFRAAGLDPYAAVVVVAKSPCGFRAVYERQAAAIYSVRAPGCAPPNFWEYEYTEIPRPLWPWDEIDQWQARPEIFGGTQ